MVELIEFLLISLALVLSFILLIFLIRRTAFLFSLLKLRKSEEIEVRLVSLISLFLPFTAKKPLAKVRVRKKLFSIYLYHGGGRWRYVHIASDRYTVVFSKLGGKTVRSASRTLGTSKRVIINLPSGVSRSKVRLLPEIKESEAIPLLVFSPEPAELTYVTKERTSIKVAFTGERVGSWLIFTKDTLLSYLDRESRGFFD